MSSWVQRQVSSHHTQLVAAAILSGVTVAGLILGVQGIRRQVAVDELKSSIPNIDEQHDTETVCSAFGNLLVASES